MKISTIIVLIVLAIAIVGNVIFISRYTTAQRELDAVRTELAKYTTNEKILSFGQLFVEKVLRAGEVSFDDRVKLENAALGIGNAEVLEAWKRFVESKTEVQAQETVKELLGALFKTIAL